MKSRQTTERKCKVKSIFPLLSELGWISHGFFIHTIHVCFSFQNWFLESLIPNAYGCVKVTMQRGENVTQSCCQHLTFFTVNYQPHAIVSLPQWLRRWPSKFCRNWLNRSFTSKDCFLFSLRGNGDFEVNHKKAISLLDAKMRSLKCRRRRLWNKICAEKKRECLWLKGFTNRTTAQWKFMN